MPIVTVRKILMTSQWMETKDRPAESLVGAYCAESTDQWTAGSGIMTKIPPLFDGSTSWCKYEELIDDWLDLTVPEAEKRGPALKNRLVGDAEMYKGLLDRESLRATKLLAQMRRRRASCSQTGGRQSVHG